VEKHKRNKLQGPLKLPFSSQHNNPSSCSNLSLRSVANKPNMHIQEMQAAPSADLVVLPLAFKLDSSSLRLFLFSFF
jgi:hypothetical protein